MCIISLEVSEVANTKILVGPNADKTKQITVYSNSVDNTSNHNAMILPVPFPESVEFIDLTAYSDVFDDCDKMCKREKFLSMNSSRSFSYDSSDAEEPLKVFRVGSFDVSLARNLADLSRVNGQVFKLSQGCKGLLERTYTKPFWGFIICKLADGPEKYHPFAYSHRLVGGKVFVPTKHYHTDADSVPVIIGSDMRGRSSDKYTEHTIRNSPMFQPFINEEFAENRQVNRKHTGHSTSDKMADDWAHNIYLINCNKYNGFVPPSMKHAGLNGQWNGENHINRKLLSWDFGKITNFEKLSVHGTHPNTDLAIVC